jgi:hypothetical protein
MYRRISYLVLGSLLAAAPGETEERIQTMAEYQADVRIQAGSFVLAGPIHHAPLKERQALAVQGTSIPVRELIIRHDQNVAWVIDNQSRSYFAAPIPSTLASGDDLLSNSITEKRKISSEPIDGIEAEKYQIKSAETGVGHLVGNIWLTSSNIALRFEGEYIIGDRSTPLQMRLANLKIVPQAPELFEVPEDFTLVPPSHPTRGILGRPANGGLDSGEE